VHFGGRTLARGRPCFSAAEVGINHNGDLDLALEMISAAADAGADAVKFQNYRTEDFIVDRSLTHEYVSRGETIVESQYDMFKRYEMPSEWLGPLKRRCDEDGVVFFSTPTSRQGIDDLLSVGTQLIKNGSDYLGHLPLISDLARSGVPTVLSTGMAEKDEIDAAVAAYHQAGGQQLVLLHCTSVYPTPIEEASLSRMLALRERYQCPVGFSDHTEGWQASSLAVAMGAVFVEKHFTTDRTLPGPDHRFSSTPAEFRTLVDNIRFVERVMGRPTLVSGDCEQSSRHLFRLSCRASRRIPAGTVLTAEDVSISRPGDGIEPARIDEVIGRILVRTLEAGDAIRTDDLLETQA
ncbi:MAG: N-acetylneuraminate synthase family protein, partial [Actinomycetota bacterium]|nr:N-acetylneuraminate synthase family protein [Actinomycetota bacterium]